MIVLLWPLYFRLSFFSDLFLPDGDKMTQNLVFPMFSVSQFCRLLPLCRRLSKTPSRSQLFIELLKNREMQESFNIVEEIDRLLHLWYIFYVRVTVAVFSTVHKSILSLGAISPSYSERGYGKYTWTLFSRKTINQRQTWYA